jgi:zinc D-Ala-D-Ala carboxypeptidase
MSYVEPGSPTRRRTRAVVAAVVLAICASFLGYSWLASASSSLASPLHHTHGHHVGRLGVDDGVVPDAATVFDDELPAVTNLDPALLVALRAAAEDAAKDGVELQLNSGWRSRAYQAELLREAVADHGSREEAARWVATPETSPHVSGDAVDLGPSGALWLADHGAAYGLCRIYGNEPWHYELRPDAIQAGCPPAYADPTHDPRMQR